MASWHYKGPGNAFYGKRERSTVSNAADISTNIRFEMPYMILGDHTKNSFKRVEQIKTRWQWVEE